MWYFWSLLMLYAAISGVKDGILYSHQTNSPLGFNEHKIWVMERIVVSMIFIGMAFFDLSIFQIIQVCLSNLLCFSFVHNGYYYDTRSRIDVKEYHWFSQSESTTAKKSFNGLERSVLFLAGISIMFIK
jgi:hypothetical protein